MKKTIIFGIMMILILTGCSKPSAENNLRNQGIPDFTINLLKMSAQNCLCEIDDQTSRIVCTCSNPSWEKDIRAVCSSPPTDEYDAVQKCFAVTQEKI